ncbi:MAG TPA: glycoside hydrolase family 15 protein [Burkholderiales bacterium]|nr:glycoside hydrolase family 15 protein [Burkholderiales bacterium]
MNEQSGPVAGMAPSSHNNKPVWASSRKDMVGGTLGSARLWFTVAQGIVSEVYFPRIDIPQLKDLGFIVADGGGYWEEIRRVASYKLDYASPGIPALTVRYERDRYTLVLRICPDPRRDVLLIDITLTGDADLRAYVLAAPRLGGNTVNNRAWADGWEGRALLWAEQPQFGLALMCADTDGMPGFSRRSVGIAGESDLWQDFNRHGCMTWNYAQTPSGEVTLGGELPRRCTLALGLGSSKEAAATLAWSALAQGFDAAWQTQCSDWADWQAICRWPSSLDRLPRAALELLHISASVLKVHQDHTYPGAAVASLSIPWGEYSASLGGYHLVWSRDLVETAGALLAMNDMASAREILCYLIATQQAGGHWLQNQWLGGKAFWQGIQLDETAFPVLLAAALRERGALTDIRTGDMVRRALRFILQEGPATGQDRWEEDAGINTFTLAVVISALVEGGLMLEGKERDCALMMADYWNARLEDWTWVENTLLAQKLGVPGYYLRSEPDDQLTHEGAKAEHLLIKNRSLDPGLAAEEQLATDFLQLVRYGLRDARDRRILSSIAAIDALLRTDTPSGPVWHRYNGDGYGEHEDGKPFDGDGCGRGWPLLSGERGHYALLAGDDPLPYIEAMAAMTGNGGLLPEQVWDSAPVPKYGLYPGKPSGSAMPLVWAHAEYIKLCLSYASGAPVDRPVQTWRRYQGRRPAINYYVWSLKQRLHVVPAGKSLRVLLNMPATVHWGINGWQNIADTEVEDQGLAYVASLPSDTLQSGDTLEFTFYYPDTGIWQQEDFQVRIVARGDDL